jgi:hypothetical protein
MGLWNSLKYSSNTTYGFKEQFEVFKKYYMWVYGTVSGIQAVIHMGLWNSNLGYSNNTTYGFME